MAKLVRALFAAGALALAACGSGDEKESSAPAPAPTAPAPVPASPPQAPVPAPAPVPTPQSTGSGVGVREAAANELFAARCALCHGPDGRGDGPGSAALNPKPRNYHDKAWQASVTDDQIEKTIVEGGAAVGKSPVMPAHPDLASNPEVLAALVAKIRSLGK
jgi:mono/diheme cytochrome c family protein